MYADNFSYVVKVSLLKVENSFNLTMLFLHLPLMIFFSSPSYALHTGNTLQILFYNLKHFCKIAQTVRNCDKVNIVEKLKTLKNIYFVVKRKMRKILSVSDLKKIFEKIDEKKITM